MKNNSLTERMPEIREEGSDSDGIDLSPKQKQKDQDSGYGYEYYDEEDEVSDEPPTIKKFMNE